MTSRTRWSMGLLGAGALGYAMSLVAVSFMSTPRVLPAGEALHFCGFYLDCHTSVVVDSLRMDAPGLDGMWRYTVRVRFGNDAVRATLAVRAPRAELIDARGGTSTLRAVSGVDGLTIAQGHDVGAEFVFISPRRLEEPRLRLAVGEFPERLTEFFLIGDENSLWHARTELAMPGVTEHAGVARL